MIKQSEVTFTENSISGKTPVVQFLMLFHFRNGWNKKLDETAVDKLTPEEKDLLNRIIYTVEDQDGNTILEYGDELTDEHLTILKKATPVKVVFWTDDVRYDGFTPGCKNLKVRIEHNTKKQEYMLNFKVKKDVVTEMA